MMSYTIWDQKEDEGQERLFSYEDINKAIRYYIGFRRERQTFYEYDVFFLAI